MSREALEKVGIHLHEQTAYQDRYTATALQGWGICHGHPR